MHACVLRDCKKMGDEERQNGGMSVSENELRQMWEDMSPKLKKILKSFNNFKKEMRKNGR